MGKDMELGRQVGERIRTLRKAQGVTVERLAEAADISVQYVSDIERGRKNMTIPILKRIVLALHTTADYLLFGRTELGPLGDAAVTRLREMPPIERMMVAQLLTKASNVVEELGWERE